MFPTSCIYHYPLFLGAQILLVNGCRMSYIYDIFIHNHHVNYTMHGDKIKPSAFFLHACSLDLEPPRHWSCGWGGWCDLLRLWNLPWQCCWQVVMSKSSSLHSIALISQLPWLFPSLFPSLLPSLLSSLLLWRPSWWRIVWSKALGSTWCVCLINSDEVFDSWFYYRLLEKGLSYLVKW